LWAAGRLGKKAKGPPEVLFGQVREDAAVEVAALAVRDPPETAFCIGSGGCTAFSLLTASPSQLHMVDINPAQVNLLELKKAAFERLSYHEMLRTMTADARPVYPDLRPVLTPEARAFWDRRLHRLAQGLNQCGIIEAHLERGRRLFLRFLAGRRRIDTMFCQTDLAAQRGYYRTNWDSWRWKGFFRLALSRPVLRLAYGKQFVDQIPPGFPQIMKRQVDAAFQDFPILENGYLWQTFLGKYPPSVEGLPVYLRPAHHTAVQMGLARVVLACSDAATWLTRQPPASIGFFALSNILEVASPAYAARLAEAIWQAAKPGAVVCLRFIFPTGPDALLRYQDRLIPDQALSEQLARSDRSLFCKFIQVLRVNR
jgi:S-adenosylmethionine-diacylglycerol 3-amino-3-carboxypropyl transferase